MSAGGTSEVEETLRRLKEHKGVIGVVIVNQDGVPIRTTLDQNDTVKYAGLITQLCSKARSAVRELDPTVRSHHYPTRRFHLADMAHSIIFMYVNHEGFERQRTYMACAI